MMRIRVIGFDKATAQIRAAIRGGIEDGLTIAGARGEALVKQNIASAYLGRPPAVATGTLLNSVAFEIYREKNFSRAVVFAAPPASNYAAYVEAGTGPHFPPPHALLLWVKKKFNAKSEEQALSIAFAVARKIAKRGTSGFGMFARAFRVLEGELQGIFEASIAREIQTKGLAK